MKKSIFFVVIFILISLLIFMLVGCNKKIGTDTQSAEFTINFEVDGQIYKTIMIAANEQIILPQHPSKPNNTFIGWFYDKDTWQEEFTESSIISNHITVYAKFVTNQNPEGNDKTFTGIEFGNVIVDYNGTEHVILCAGLPQGAEVTYTNNKGIDAGVYNAKAVVTKEGYKNLTLTATLTIRKIELKNEFVFENKTFEYNEQIYSISVTGAFPPGVVVVYNGGEYGTNTAQNVGVYTITATISGENYITKQLIATLKIKTTEERLSVILDGDNLLFQNALDKNKFYSYNNDNLKKINNEKPEYFVKVDGTVYYFSPSIISSNIASFNGTNSNNLFEVNGEYLSTDNTYLYYATISLFNADKNGIYKVKIADLNNSNVDPMPIKLTSCKAEHLVYVNGYIYFSNISDDGKLYRIHTNANGAEAELVYNYKISELIVSDNVLYFTRHVTLSNFSAGAAIYRIDVDGDFSLPLDDNNSRVKKITMSKGKYLVKAGEFIYFVNTDMVTNTIFGDGIYRAKADGSGFISDALLIGTSRLIDGTNNNVYSLATDGNNIYYYRANDKHLYKYNIYTETEIDIMNGFVPINEEKIIATTNEKTAQYNGEIYYINMRDGGKLYKYSPVVNEIFRISGLEVADFTINGDYLYYATVRFFVNFDLYRLHIITGELERISTEKCLNLVIVGDKIYYSNFSEKNSLDRMNLDGTNNETLFSKDKINPVSNQKGAEVENYPIYYLNGKIYFVATSLYEYDISTDIVVKHGASAPDKFSPKEYIIINNNFYGINTDGTNTFISYDLTNNVVFEISELKRTILGHDDARSIFIHNNYLYFFRNSYYPAYPEGSKDSPKKGLYRVDIASANPTAELVTTLDDYYMSNAIVVNGTIYFLDVWLYLDNKIIPSSSGKLCMLDLTTLIVTVLAE